MRRVMLLVSSLYWSPILYSPAGNVKELSHCVNVTEGPFQKKQSLVIVLGGYLSYLVFYLVLICGFKNGEPVNGCFISLGFGGVREVTCP